jgi:hypothetical protein
VSSPNGDILCHVGDMSATCFGHVGDMFWSCRRHDGMLCQPGCPKQHDMSAVPNMSVKCRSYVT